MFRPVTTIASHTVLVLAGLVSTSASATEVCDLYTTYVSCSRECYSLIAPVISAECDLTNAVTTIEADAFDPPPSPLLKCSHEAGTSTCEAWPQSEELSYTWSGDTSTTSSLTSSPDHSFACGAGTVSVSIITSTGATSVATATIPDCN
jgi:hypothetical protein